MKVTTTSTYALALAAIAFAGHSSAAITSTQVDNDASSSSFVDDGAVSGGEYSATYNNGGGAGFGGTVGSGSLFMDADSSNLYIGFDPGAGLDNNAVLYLDTRAGGVLDSEMNDQADGGRAAVSQLTRDVNDVFPTGVLPDFAVVFGSFGTVVFELTTHAGDESNPTSGHLNFIAFEGDQVTNDESIIREIGISLATLGNPEQVGFFMSYTSDTMFNSNESLPASAGLNAGGNPGFDNGGLPVTYEDSNVFVIVPEPGSLALLGLGGLLVARRRR